MGEWKANCRQGRELFNMLQMGQRTRGSSARAVGMGVVHSQMGPRTWAVSRQGLGTATDRNSHISERAEVCEGVLEGRVRVRYLLTVVCYVLKCFQLCSRILIPCVGRMESVSSE